ncbi:MAG: pilus assembly protein N-terminal domain-containing protein, partial [Pseudomonadota bacterium]
MKRLQQAVTASTLALGLCLAPVVATAQTNPTENPLGVSTLEPGETGVSRTLSLGANKSVIVDLDRPAADLIITNPAIADATVQTAKRIIFRGVEPGQTNAFIFDSRGRPILNLEISVAADTTAINEIIKRYVPGARVTVEGANTNVIVSGVVDNLLQSDQVMRLVQAYLPTGDVTPINMLTIRAKDQVMMEVRIVEMQRSVVKQLGINLGGALNLGDLEGVTEGSLFADVAGDGIDAAVNTGETSLFSTTPYQQVFGIESSNSVQPAQCGALDAE